MKQINTSKLHLEFRPICQPFATCCDSAMEVIDLATCTFGTCDPNSSVFTVNTDTVVCKYTVDAIHYIGKSGNVTIFHSFFYGYDFHNHIGSNGDRTIIAMTSCFIARARPIKCVVDGSSFCCTAEYHGEFCENGPLKTEKWSAKTGIVFSRPKSSF